MNFTQDEKTLTIWALISYKEHPWGEDNVEQLDILIDKFQTLFNKND